MTEELMIFNGINGATGNYDLPPQNPGDIASVARGTPISDEHKTDIAIRKDLDASSADHFGLREGLDPTQLNEAGWGVIFPKSLEQNRLAALKEALNPLLEHRQEGASQDFEHYYKECSGELGYHPKQSKSDFLRMHGRGPGAADPDKLPYYLLIVGDPETVPYSFQYQLDVQYAVGRIHFDNLEDYYRYAVSVVEAEKRDFSLPKGATFFGTANPDDRATQLSAENLVKPLADYVANGGFGWDVNALVGEQASKANLAQTLQAEQAPPLLFTASHGMSFPNGDARQFPHQGALLCQDWPGPRGHRGPVPEDLYFSADDLGEDANVLGLLAFFFACYGAGTPQMDDFYRKAYVDRKAIAPHAFLSRLPQRMLAHPKGGALAVVGHVERAWGYSFFWDGVGQELVTFEDALKRLLEGHPLGSALEGFNTRYAELASDLTVELDETTEEIQNTVKIAGLWTASNDARNYMIMGDPAVKLRVGKQASTSDERPAITEIVGRTPAGLADAGATTPQPESVGEPVTATAASAAEIDYGLLDTFRQTQASMGVALGQFVDKLGNFLGAALDEATTLEVSTYVSDKMGEIEYDRQSGKFKGASLRALTRIEIDGDTLICVPEQDGVVDTDLWEIHMDMVQQAQTSRAELLKTVVSAATGLVDLLKP